MHRKPLKIAPKSDPILYPKQWHQSVLKSGGCGSGFGTWGGASWVLKVQQIRAHSR